MKNESQSQRELSGKTALVTGGTKGTGKAIAARLLQAGARVIITARNTPDMLDEKYHFIAADLSTPTGMQSSRKHHSNFWWCGYPD